MIGVKKCQVVLDATHFLCGPLVGRILGLRLVDLDQWSKDLASSKPIELGSHKAIFHDILEIYGIHLLYIYIYMHKPRVKLVIDQVGQTMGHHALCAREFWAGFFQEVLGRSSR